MPDVQVKEHCFVCDDGMTLAGTVYAPAGTPRAGVLVCGALGVPRQFYGRYATWLAARGLTVMTFDYRGTGDSPLPPGRVGSTDLADWGRLDLHAAIGTLADRLSGRPLFVVGHSCGGQLIGLAANATRISGAVLVAATAPNWKRYPFPGRFKMLLVWHALVPLISRGRDLFPARRLGMSTLDVPSGVMAQWARWARSQDYLFSPEHGLDTTGYDALHVPMLSLGFDDDGYASHEAIEALLRHYGSARVEHRQVEVRTLGVGRLEHFGYFREKVRDSLWPDTLIWLDGVIGGPA